MLSIILGILGSGGFGSIVGLVGGFLNRKQDLAVKKLELETRKVDREYELARLDKEREYMTSEYGMKLRIADKEVEAEKAKADAAVEVAGYGAMTESYKFAAPTPEDGLVDKISKVVRPLLTIAFFIFTGVIFYQVQLLVNALAVAPTPEQVLKLYIMLIEWVLFQAGVCIGWWYAMRPGRLPKVA